jgi:hypothetical protein
MDIYWNIFTMHGPMNVKCPNNTSKWQMEFNSAFKGLMTTNSTIHSTKHIISFCVYYLSHRQDNQQAALVGMHMFNLMLLYSHIVTVSYIRYLVLRYAVCIKYKI